MSEVCQKYVYGSCSEVSHITTGSYASDSQDYLFKFAELNFEDENWSWYFIQRSPASTILYCTVYYGHYCDGRNNQNLKPS